MNQLKLKFSQLYIDKNSSIDDSESFNIFQSGLLLCDAPDFFNNLAQSNLTDFQYALHMLRNSFIVLGYNHEGSHLVVSSPFLIKISMMSQFEQKKKFVFNDFYLHADALIHNEKDLVKIINPKSSSYALFSFSFTSLLSLLNKDPLLFFIFLECQLVSETLSPQPDSSSLIDSLFFLKTETFNSQINIEESYRLSAANKIKHPSVQLINDDYPKLDFHRAIFDRASIRIPSKNLNQASLKNLLNLTFGEKSKNDQVHFGQRLYPAAGALYEIYPMIQISSDNFIGFKRGMYLYNPTIDDPFVFLSPEINPAPKDFFGLPNVCISLVADLNISREKYGSLALKLSILNAGVLVAYLNIFSTALGLNGSSYGLSNIKLQQVETGEISICGFCLF